MTKAEILKQLTDSGQVGTFRRSENWEKAFKLYNDTTKQHKNMNCGTCYRDVLAWLKA